MDFKGERVSELSASDAFKASCTILSSARERGSLTVGCRFGVKEIVARGRTAEVCVALGVFLAVCFDNPEVTFGFFAGVVGGLEPVHLAALFCFCVAFTESIRAL